MNITPDLIQMLEETGLSIAALSRASGVDYTTLSEIIKGKKKKSAVDQLIPFVYGDKRPPALPPEFKKPRKKKTEE